MARLKFDMIINIIITAVYSQEGLRVYLHEDVVRGLEKQELHVLYTLAGAQAKEQWLCTCSHRIRQASTGGRGTRLLRLSEEPRPSRRQPPQEEAPPFPSLLPQEEQEAMMRQHAAGDGGGGAAAPASAAQKPRAEPAGPVPFDTLAKGFLGKSKSSLYPNNGTNDTGSEKDLEFDKLMQQIDPELASGFRDLFQQPEDPLADQLADLARALGPLEEREGPPPPPQAPEELAARGGRGGAAAAEPPPLRKLAYRTEEEEEQEGGTAAGGSSARRTVTVAVSLEGLRPEEYAAVQLEAEEGGLVVLGPGVEALRVPVPFAVHDGCIKASLKRKAKLLKIRISQPDS